MEIAATVSIEKGRVMAGFSAVLVVIDVQNGFVSAASAPAVPAIVELAARWHRAGGEIVFARYLNYPDSNFVRLRNWSRVMGPPESDIVPELAPLVPKAVAVVEKTMYSLFNKQGDALVREHEWTDLYICGFDTEACVFKTAVDAFERGLTPWVIEDATASSYGQEAHEMGLHMARHLVGPGQVISMADIPPGAATSQH